VQQKIFLTFKKKEAFMATKKTTSKWTPAQKKEHIAKIQKLVTKLKSENKFYRYY
jgi:hypothetical protein